MNIHNNYNPTDDNKNNEKVKRNARERILHLQSVGKSKKKSIDDSSRYSDIENNNIHKPKNKANVKIVPKVSLHNKQFVETCIETESYIHDLEGDSSPNEENSKGLNNNNECTTTEQIDLDSGSSSRISMGAKRSIETLNSDVSFVKKRRERRLPRKIEELERNEKLFIRLLKLDFPSKSSEIITNSYSVTTNAELYDVNETPEDDPPIKAKLLPKLEKPTTKISKTEVHKKNLLNINKTESLKMEQLLLEKFKKAKEKQANEDSSKEESGNHTNEVEPYVYEKTTKSVFETYKQTEDKNGQIILRCLLCPFTGEKFRQMSLHYKFKHRDTPIEEMHFCEVKGCNFKTVHKGMFKWHMKRHMLAADQLISDVYPCGQCNKVFEQRKSFLIHLKLMHKDPALIPKKTVFPCATCKFTTTAKQNLQAHIYRSHVPDNVKPTYKCNLCGYKTHYKDCLRKHLTRVHLQKKK